MINQAYFNKIPPKNTLRDLDQRVLSTNPSNISSSDLLGNMILNSNLGNGNLIK